MGRLPWLWGPPSGGKIMFCILLKGGGSLRRMDLNSSQRGGVCIDSVPSRVLEFFCVPSRPRGETRYVCCPGLPNLAQEAKAPGTPRGRRPGRVPLGCRTGGLLERPFDVFLGGLEKKKKCVCFPRAHVTHQSEPDLGPPSQTIVPHSAKFSLLYYGFCTEF